MVSASHLDIRSRPELEVVGMIVQRRAYLSKASRFAGIGEAKRGRFAYAGLMPRVCRKFGES